MALKRPFAVLFLSCLTTMVMFSFTRIFTLSPSINLWKSEQIILKPSPVTVLTTTIPITTTTEKCLDYDDKVWLAIISGQLPESNLPLK
ncbi:unnamed protein product [Cercopithifilaria johnstoni]|uniref:Uncharacterized protein n=1 Tax=Cercopithifilaria johnstoni TaxID=2874296 RepID=A0A8J2M1Q6_9BILA|nr:unnamed protein product [Cercopithifilaria johnstoni]